MSDQSKDPLYDLIATARKVADELERTSRALVRANQTIVDLRTQIVTWRSALQEALERDAIYAAPTAPETMRVASLIANGKLFPEPHEPKLPGKRRA